MYESHFGLRFKPFRTTPDLEGYYPATSHERVLGLLQQALDDEEGLLLVTGDPGTGKTLLCHALLEKLGDSVATALLTNSHFPDRAALLQSLLFDLRLPHEQHGEQMLRLTLTDHLLQSMAAGRRTVLVIDEAQHLSPDLLEELRLLGNLESRRRKAVQIVLAAQTGLETTLSLPDLHAFRQRLAVRARLEPLDLHEAADYLLHQLRRAGGQPQRILSDEALEVLARLTQGVPRLLNQAAHQSLLLAYSAGVSCVDAEVALEALALLGLDAGQETSPMSFPAERSEGTLANPLLSLTEAAGALEEELESESAAGHLFAPPSRPA
jgi:type II secretory pathway predicted ATPase ExeA